MRDALLLAAKIEELKAEMKLTGVWSAEIPPWVNKFENLVIATEQDFNGWLQFVYLPNLQATNRNALLPRDYIVPQAIKFWKPAVEKGRMLQLLIELDAL
jgi:uncharacterized protein YqcC (DUF446 family)